MAHCQILLTTIHPNHLSDSSKGEPSSTDTPADDPAYKQLGDQDNVA